MTREGSAAFGAQWKTTEAKIVEVPAIPDAMPEFKTTYDIEPHAGASGFDDSSWPAIEPHSPGCGARRRQSVVHLVPDEPDDAGADRRLRNVGGEGRAHAQRRRLRGSLGQRGAAARARQTEPDHDPGFQHAQSYRAQRCDEGGRPVSARGLRHQRADFGCTSQHCLVPGGEGRILSLTALCHWCRTPTIPKGKMGSRRTEKVAPELHRLPVSTPQPMITTGAVAYSDCSEQNVERSRLLLLRSVENLLRCHRYRHSRRDQGQLGCCVRMD